MIKPWVFEFVEVFRPVNAVMSPEHYASVYDWHFDQWQRIEDIGFEGIFFSEHHFRDGRLMPSPHLLIAAVAMRTKKLRLGVMGSVLPLHQPWRFAEEVGMLDLITHGRYEMGLSSGSHPNEITAVGLTQEELRPRYDEEIDIVEKALTEDAFDHAGRFWQFEGLTTFPKPIQKPLPSRWITGVSEGSAKAAAERGYRYCTGFLDVDKVKTIFDAYRSAAKEAGNDAGAEQLALRRQIFVADTESEALEIARASSARLAADKEVGPYKTKRAGAPAPRETTTAAGGHSSAAPDAPSTVGKLNLFDGKDETIAGAPKQVAEMIIDQCRRVGAGHIVGYVFQGVTREQVRRNYELWRDIIPVLRSADLA